MDAQESRLVLGCRSLPVRGLTAILLLSLVICSAGEPAEFFENEVRPIFAEHCYACHSEQAEKLKGGLRLDSGTALLRGGDSGPVMVPGDPEASLLIRAVRYQDADLQMPPKGRKLSDKQIAALEAWVKAGASLPPAFLAPIQKRPIAKVRAEHWAFQKLHKPAVPQVKNRRWIQSPVDAFVLAKLEQKDLAPAPAADRRTLIRRLSYDLLGLPPSLQEVEEFVHNENPGAYAQLLDRYLASPQYGERWARHWLDVARYADTKGYLAGGEERRYAFSYTYRDYVVRAFNEDKPYDQFLIEQIAADQLTLGEDKHVLAALGFLTLGRRFLNNRDDIIDDRIDVVTRGTLGLTVACARCHDHKFDPIRTEDYYALHGVFASTEEPSEHPLLGPLRDSADYQDYLKQKAKIETEIVSFETKEIAQFLAQLRQNVGDYLLAARDVTGLKDPAGFDTFAGERKVLPAALRRWMADLEHRRQQPDLVVGPWFAFSDLPDSGFATNAAAILARLEQGSAKINPEVLKAFAGSPPATLKQVAEVYSKLFKDVENEWQAARGKAEKENKPMPPGLPDSNREALRQILYAEGAPPNIPESEVRRVHARRLGEGAAPLRNKIEALNWTHPGAPPRAMALIDQPQPHNSHVARRGNPANPGPEVPRHFLEVLSPNGMTLFTNGSGRLELARAITSPQNPLTARVYVNRVWLHHFGEGLVNTPGDFGVRTEPPVQRDLLDFLAATFLEGGQSTKQLHRLIVLSATYQQSSEPDAHNLQADPDNRLLHHFNRHRLDFEQVRDSLLAVAGNLDLKIGGLPVDIIDAPFSSRRTLYGLIDRQNLPGLFRTFDFANPDTSSQRRFSTTVPQQALFMMNSPFALEEARRLAQRPEVSQAQNRTAQVQALYRLVCQRPAASAELRDAERFLTSQAGAGTTLSPLEKYAHVLLLSNELMFVD